MLYQLYFTLLAVLNCIYGACFFEVILIGNLLNHTPSTENLLEGCG